MTFTPPKYLVTGAAGFLGSRLAKQLAKQGHLVRGVDLVEVQLPGVEMVVGDLRVEEVIRSVLQDVEIVFHCAAFVSTDPREDAMMHDINIVATQQLLEICRRLRIHKFIYASSVDVVFNGRPIRKGDEDLPYPAKYIDYYSYSKAAAEQAVLHAHSPMGMLTTSLRLPGIYGPGDPRRLPEMIQKMRQKNYLAIGKGEAEFNHVYIDNAIHAFTLACDRLDPESAHGGSAYFITDHAPTFFFDFYMPIMEGLGYRPQQRRIPYAMAYMGAQLMSWWHALPWNHHRSVPTLTPFRVASTGRDFSFVHDKATEDFGYHPLVTKEGAMKATIRDLRERGFAAHHANT